MRKTFIIAAREYLAAVKTKSFIISLVLLPIMMSGGLIAQKLGQKFGDVTTKRIAIIDRSPGEVIYHAVEQSVQRRNTSGVFDESGKQVRAKFELENVAPAPAGDADPQRLQLSRRVRKGELLAFVEVGPDVLKAPPAGVQTTTRSSDEEDDSEAGNDPGAIRYTTNRPTYRDFISLLEAASGPAVYERRLADAGFSYQGIKPLLARPRIVDRGLAEEREPGKITFEARGGQFAPFIVPLALLMLMFIVVIVGASPMTANVIEEKQLRIAEVLLGSVRPFELMMGKLLGGVAVALTLAAIYFGGAYYVAFTQGMAGYVTPGTILWFLFFTILGTLMYGSMFVAAGAAVTNIKEAQTMVMPVMLLIVLPISLVGQMIQDPSGTLAMIGSFFPFSAPMVMTARLAIPPGVPAWQALLAAAIALTTTMVLVWAAGRIFRVGILMQGQGANYAELARWIVRG
jgi:ABC-type Na+ efflux pump permease subunit